MEYILAIPKDSLDRWASGDFVTLKCVEIASYTDVWYIVPVSSDEVRGMPYDEFHSQYDVIPSEPYRG